MNNISFIIPAYNSEKTLAESVNSIFAENFEDGDEIIIVDDCSTDKTDNLVKNLVKKYSGKIKSITNQENRGCPASRNIGIKEAKNTLIFNLDSDNILSPRSIQKLKKALLAQNADIASFQEYYYFKEDTSKITHRWICKNSLFTMADLFSGMINPAPGGNFLYRKSKWEEIGGYWEYGKGLHEAWGFSFKLLLSGAKFIIVPNTFYFHRYSHESLFVRENKKNNESIKVSNKFIEKSLHIFDEDSLIKIKNNPDWLNNLEIQPLRLKNQKLGDNGKIIFNSAIKQALCLIKKIFTK